MRRLTLALRYRLTNRQRATAVCFVASLALFALSVTKEWTGLRQELEDDIDYNEFQSELGNNFCRIPQLRPFDPSIAPYLKEPEPLRCNTLPPNWIYIQQGRFHIYDHIQEKFGKVTCQGEMFWFADDHSYNTKLYTELIEGEKLPGDAWKIDCKAEDGSSHTGIYSTSVPLNTSIARLRERGVNRDLAATDLSVYMLSYDSVSRMAAERTMPKTLRFLTETLDAAILKGYNILGDGTPAAFTPILTGGDEDEMPDCYKGHTGSQHVDVFPWIWKNFSAAGYATMYGEDTAKVGTYTYRMNGFKRQPTDHYPRMFYLRAEQFQASIMDIIKWHYVQCLGNERQHVVFMRLAAEMFDNYPVDIPKFVVMHHGALSHDDVNSAQLADADTADHLAYMYERGHLNKSIFMFWSDHGHRFNRDIRATYQGQLEERLPLMSISAPKWFRDGVGKKAWQNLLSNRDRLTTPFDMHETLRMILKWRKPVDADVSLNRGVSLFDAIPENRTCAQAGVKSHWCACLQWRDVGVSSDRVHQIATDIVEHINQATEQFRTDKCVQLKLDKITNARRLTLPKQANERRLAVAQYQLRFVTKPGNAHYEATVLYRSSRGTKVDLKDISQINPYDDNPHCIIDTHHALAKFCVCYDKVS